MGGDGNATSTCSDLRSGCYGDCTCMLCHFAYTNENFFEVLLKLCNWSWLHIILLCTFGRFPFIKIWEFWPLLCSLFAWAKQPVKYKAALIKNCFERLTFSPILTEFNFEIVSLTAPYFFIKNGVWQCAGFDSSVREWRRLPPFNYLPAYCKPDLDLFKEYLVSSKDGIVCMNVSKTSEDRLIVFNPLTGRWRELPPLIHRRNPVLMHLVVDAATGSYQVIVAGSSKSGDERLSRVTEVFDFRRGKWKRTGDLPGPDYGLNDYQTGVFIDGHLYCIAFLDQVAGRGILRYNLSKGVWLKDWTYVIPFSRNSTNLQLVDCWGELYLFSEQGHESNVEQCIDKVEWDSDIEGGVSWRLKNVTRIKKTGGPSMEVYPEYTCISYKKHHVCIFNTIEHSGVVYDVRNQRQSEVLQAPPADQGFSGEGFFSLNPMSFTIELSFSSINI